MRFRRAAWMFASSYGSFLVGIVSTIILAPIAIALLGQEGYGLWMVIGGLVGFLVVLDLGISATVVRYVANLVGRGEEDRLSRLLSTGLTIYLGVAVIAALAGVGLAWLAPTFIEIPATFRDGFVWALVLAGVRVGLSFPTGLFRGTLRGLQRGYVGDLITTLAVVVSLGGNIGLLYQGWGLVALVAPNVVIGFVEIGALYIWVRKDHPSIAPRLGVFDRTVLSGAASFSALVFMNQIAGQLVFSTDTIVAGAFLGAAPAAIYALTFKATQMATQSVFKVSDAAFPAISELHGEGDLGALTRAHREASKLTAALAFPAALIVVAYNDVFVQLWVGAENYGGLLLTAVFAYLLIHHTFTHVSALVLMGTGAVRGMTIVSLVEAGINLGLSLFLVQTMGLPGIAVATVIAGVLTSGWYVPWRACRELGTPLSEFLFWALGRVVGLTALLALGLYALSTAWEPGTLIELGGAVAAMLGAYALLFYGIGLNASERGRYRERFRTLLTTSD